jgi:hypothetical protein
MLEKEGFQCLGEVFEQTEPIGDLEGIRRAASA